MIKPQASMANFALPEQSAEQFRVNIVKALVTGNVPFAFVENSFFKAACGCVGVEPISRKQVAGPYLDAIFAEEQSFSRELLDEVDYLPGASDGWRKKYCADGAGLMNFTVMPESGVQIVIS